ncbi:RNA 2'-phosphotransferase [Snodgrassella alvi]|uniref:RNA 2'-phosphotransferase n=1 Tax=Snodgrassella alvi TaxID=1196083 RepID=UPI000C1E7DB5|nr:RNA 2'-phosphotransferase [Snodgrassella alvi]PIT34519.1 RNA 2'-phosphotransferase [Snodgrassella alvi]PIT35992.1 RNA 2'-phosphotransferase [Snodgrassella alvi]WLT05060.1 RNA 2'-phosphotransferase [Snodgrassella alvi]
MNTKLTSEKIIKTSKFLSYILRHKPETIDITLDQQGWVNIEYLIKQANLHGEQLTRNIIEVVVKTSDKKRFTISEDGLKIRAAQGHSTDQVHISHNAQKPPEFLYHGTATRFMNSIKQQGLIAGSRHYVHLSADVNTAIKVGTRHGSPIVLQIHALIMYQAGYQFYLAGNGVWLVQTVPKQYLQPYE